MAMTPRQLQAFLFLASKRRQQELREELRLNTLAARGDEKQINNQLREMED
jgi:hypothetical protein